MRTKQNKTEYEKKVNELKWKKSFLASTILAKLEINSEYHFK